MIEVAIKNFVEFEFSKPPLYGIQRLRLTPKENEKQKIITWDIILKGARKETEYFDHHGNFCCLLTFEKDIKTMQREVIVAIDAGHGGKDPGRPNKSGIKEKDIVLKIALDLGKKLENSGNEVIYTRDKDIFLTLRQRAKIANDVDADLFISIHCNAFHDSSVHGSETFVYGLHVSDANFNVAKKENEIIFLDDHYQEFIL